VADLSATSSSGDTDSPTAVGLQHDRWAAHAHVNHQGSYSQASAGPSGQGVVLRLGTAETDQLLSGRGEADQMMAPARHGTAGGFSSWGASPVTVGAGDKCFWPYLSLVLHGEPGVVFEVSANSF